MEIANAVLFLVLAMLSLPCFLILILLTEALLRAATPLLQRQARSHFAWPPQSAFRLPASPAAAFRAKAPPPPPPSAVGRLRVAAYKRCSTEVSPTPSGSASAAAAAEAERADACCCVFCLCDVEEGDEIREIPCRHVFHRQCLDTWLQHRRATCPLCRDRLGEVVGDEDEDELEESATILVAYVHSSGWWAW